MSTLAEKHARRHRAAWEADPCRFPVGQASIRESTPLILLGPRRLSQRLAPQRRLYCPMMNPASQRRRRRSSMRPALQRRLRRPLMRARFSAVFIVAVISLSHLGLSFTRCVKTMRYRGS